MTFCDTSWRRRCRSKNSDIDSDAAFAVDHLVNIAWANASTTKLDPALAVVACHTLRDILIRWTDDQAVSRNDAARIRYSDQVIDQLYDGLESLAVVTWESMQH